MFGLLLMLGGLAFMYMDWQNQLQKLKKISISQ
jgi:hypothetical protein